LFTILSSYALFPVLTTATVEGTLEPFLILFYLLILDVFLVFFDVSG